jgi:hypothetical protein
MKSAQQEWSALGWKTEDVSTEALNKLIETPELNERKLYNGGGLRSPTADAKQHKSKEFVF